MIGPVSWASLWHSAFFLHIWQSTIFVVAIWLLTLALRRNAARTRYRLWLIASVKFLIPFSLLVAAGQFFHSDFGSTAGQATFLSGVEKVEQPLFVTAPAANHAAVTVSTALPAPAPAHHIISILWLLAAIWAVGAIVLLVRWTRSWWRIHRALRSSSPLDLPFPVPVRATESRIEPGVFGIFRPVLLLPQGLTDRLSPSQLEAILAHERCHVRRRDNLSAALHMLVEVLFWFHPAVWWIQARLLEERELACDESVLASHGEPRSYAEGILNVCKFYVEAPMNCMSGVMGSDLKKRIARVMSHHREHPLSAGMKIALASAALVAVALPLSFGIVRPLHAQAQPVNVNAAAFATPSQQQNVFEPPHLRNLNSLPVYPRIAIDAHIQGKVLLHARFGQDGSIQELRYASGPPLLVQAAKKAVAHSQFSPALLNGRPTAAECTIVVTFTLHPQKITIAVPPSLARPIRRALPPAAAAAKPNHSIVGTWQGTLHVAKRNLRTVLKIKKSSAGKLTGTFYSIDQTGQPIPVSSVSFQNDDLKYAISRIYGSYEGKMSADGNSISGTWTQVGHSLPLVFERATPETAWTIPPPPPHIAPMAASAKPGIEVATINPTKPGTRGNRLGWFGGKMVTVGTTLDEMIKYAYRVQDKQIINGPSWMSSDKYDITAKPNVAGRPGPQQLRELFRALLADRFQFKVHTEHKTMSAYVLTVAKGGPKMQKSSNTALPRLFFGPPNVTLRASGATMNDFTDVMQASVLDRPVVDQTGLAGRWTFSLNWSPDASQFANAGFRFPPPSNPAKAGPPLFTAIQQQLGLKLGVEKTSVPVLVIDHVNHPSPN